MFYQQEHIGSPNHIKIEENENFSFPTHIHQCYEFIYLHHGCMDVTIDGKSFTLHGGESVLVFPNQVHSLESENSKHTLCIFSPEFVKSYSKIVNDKIPNDNKFVLDSETLELFFKMKDNSTEIFNKGVLYLICDNFNRFATYSKTNVDKKSLLHKMFDFVEKSFDGDCTLVALSEELGYNYSYLSRYFKNSVGMSFNNYVSNYRLNHACYLLKISDNNIIQCAFDSGFTSSRSFNRVFKQCFGMTPYEYRSTYINEI